MSPFRRKKGASYYLHLRWKGWPELRVATGTTNKSRAISMEKTLHALRSAGRRDILELIATRKLRLEDVHDTYLRDPAALEQRLAKAHSHPLGLLVDAWIAWLKDPATLSSKTRRRYSARTIAGYEWCWGQLFKLLPRGRESMLTDLTTGFVADFRALRLRSGTSGPTVNRNVTSLSAFLRPGVKRSRGSLHPGRSYRTSASTRVAIAGSLLARSRVSRLRCRRSGGYFSQP